jgi:hypothetical protein
MFAIKEKYGAILTFYFRVSTFDKNFMIDINNYGSEVGYRYDEIAHFVRKIRFHIPK